MKPKKFLGVLFIFSVMFFLYAPLAEMVGKVQALVLIVSLVALTSVYTGMVMFYAKKYDTRPVATQAEAHQPVDVHPKQRG